jgi:protoheme IX farnesyltransferase
LLGLSLIIASACVFNNFLDRDLDKKMARTKNRALPAGTIKGSTALAYAASLGAAGSLLLAYFTNLLTLALALFGLFAYVVLYGIGKRTTVWSTVIGSISGAVPPVVGYCSVSGRLDLGAVLLFMILVLWQMPHFYAIAIYRRRDYAAAGLPVLPVVNGNRNTKIQMLIYIAAFTVAAALLSVYGYTGYIYLAVMLVLGGAWLRLSLLGFKAPDDDKWARKLFGFSLIVITAFSFTVSIGHWLV